jgi:hypothetical protein
MKPNLCQTNKVKSLLNFCIVALAVSGLSARAQSTQTSTGAIGTNAGAWVAVQRGPNATAWQRLVTDTNSSGGVASHTETYRELASGLNYWSPSNNAWQPASEQIQSVPGGAAASQGQHTVSFPYDLSQDTINLVTPDWGEPQ